MFEKSTRNELHRFAAKRNITATTGQTLIAMAAQQAATGLLDTLPVRLRNFFARYPPQHYSAQTLRQISPAPNRANPTPESTTSDSSLASETATLTLASSPYASRLSKTKLKPDNGTSYTDSLLRTHPDQSYPNPFLPYKNPETGRWRGAPVSLRRQAELVKLAIKFDVEALLPPGRKSTEYKDARVLEKGLRIKGTGIGQRVKGHKWERQMKTKIDDRKKAMEEMPEMIRLWKQVCIGCFPLFGCTRYYVSGMLTFCSSF